MTDRYLSPLPAGGLLTSEEGPAGSERLDIWFDPANVVDVETMEADDFALIGTSANALRKITRADLIGAITTRVILMEMTTSGELNANESVYVGAVNRGIIAQKSGSIVGYSFIQTIEKSANANPAIIISAALGEATLTIIPSASDVAKYGTYAIGLYTFLAGAQIGMLVKNNTATESTYEAIAVRAMLEIVYD